MLLPGTSVVVPSVLVMLRSACEVRVSVSVALLLDELVSATEALDVTVAVLDSVPVADGLIVAETV